MAQPVVHFEIGGKDAARTREYYAQMFDWKYEMPGGMDYGMVAPSGEGSIGGGIAGIQPGQQPYVTIYVQVDDLKTYMDKAEKLGGKTVLPPTPIPGGSEFALIADPDGIITGIYRAGK